MLKKINSSEITPQKTYISRRDFLKTAGFTALGALTLAACKGNPLPAPTSTPMAAQTPTLSNTLSYANDPNMATRWEQALDPKSPLDTIANFTNYYEFTTDKRGVAKLAENFTYTPWSIEVSGMVNKPGIYHFEDLLRQFSLQERIYRMRCVEGWSLVIPWIGFPLSEFLKQIEPTSNAKYVKFTTFMDAKQMPGLNTPFPWPYVEGLRLDEAMHDLTILSVGLYGEHLLPQNGAPIRLVIPWKYGFKSIKSIVKIELTDQMPVSLWMATAPNEYGFYANVNPDVPHPRWSQANEMRIGEDDTRETTLFNGYADEIAHLYSDLDLKKWF